MSLGLLIGAAAVWVFAARADSRNATRGAALVHTLGVAATLLLRNDLPPAGWASVAVVALWLPVVPLLVWPTGELARLLRPAAAVTAGVSAVFAVAPPGPGVAIWSPWAIPHIVLAVLAMGASVGAALLAITNLKGRRLGLLFIVLLLTAVPLIGPRASTVIAHKDGTALTVEAAIADPEGDTGIHRILSARMALPWERPLRWAGCLVLCLAIAATVVRKHGGMAQTTGWLERITLGVLGIHVLRLGSALLPISIGTDATLIKEVARATLALETRLSEGPARILVADPPYTGGIGAVPVILPIALVAFALCFVAFRRREDIPSERGLRVELLFANAAIVFLAGTAATGIVWSNYAWGASVIADPKLFAVIVALGIYGLYFMAQRYLTQNRDLPSWLAVAALFVLMLSMLGPELGWIAPSLHHFGA